MLKLPIRQKPSTPFEKVPSLLYLWLAVLIFAASNAVTRKVTEIGAQHLIEGRNPISLCNVLFVGNLCALMVMIALFGKDWNRHILKRITWREWSSLGGIAILAGALAPSLIFAALDNTTVTNVVLIGRLEPVFTLVLGVVVLQARVNFWTVAGAIATFAGVAVTAFLASSGQLIPVMGGMFFVGRGEVFAALGALALAIATIYSKVRLQQVPLGIFTILRTTVGTVVFFILATALYGLPHFVDIFSPFLWQWMLLYGTVIVVMGQLSWFAGLRRSTPAETILASSFNPIAAIALAYLILGEVPTPVQYFGGVIILVGIGLSLMGALRDIKSRKSSIQPMIAQAMGMAIGFKGV